MRTPACGLSMMLVVAWRQWHHWNLAPGIAKLQLPAGKAVLTVHVLTEGQMNLAILEFVKAK